MLKKISISCFSLALVACGGGSDSPSNVSSLTGVFTDSPVSGLTYTIGTTSSTTGADGSFKYKEGDVVKFSIGDVILGESVGSAIVTPLNLATANSNPDLALNIARLLITLDSDGDKSNGLSINSTTTAAALANINFDQPTDTFAADTAVTTLVSAATNITLVTADTAANHMNATLTALSDNSTILSFANTQWESVITSSLCPDAKLGFTYDFTTTGFTMTGTDTLNSATCVASAESTQVVIYSGLPRDFFLTCAADGCSFSELNKLYAGIDTDNRNHISTVSYTPGSGIIKSTKRITSSTPSTWTEVFYKVGTNNTPAIKVNFVGTSWKVTETYLGCAATATATYTFNATSLVVAGNEMTSSCTTADLSGDYPYTAVSDLPCLQAGCTLSQLNSSYPWEATTVYWTYVPNGKNYDQGTIIRRKDAFVTTYVKQ